MELENSRLLPWADEMKTLLKGPEVQIAGGRSRVVEDSAVISTSGLESHFTLKAS